jgi:hypothetical protein
VLATALGNLILVLLKDNPNVEPMINFIKKKITGRDHGESRYKVKNMKDLHNIFETTPTNPSELINPYALVILMILRGRERFKLKPTLRVGGRDFWSWIGLCGLKNRSMEISSPKFGF